MREILATAISDAMFVLEFDVTNLGERPVTITSIGFQYGRWYNPEAFTLMPIKSGLAHHEYKLPKTINHGESVSFMLADEGGSYMAIAELCCEMFGLTRRRLKTLRGRVCPSVGHTSNVVLQTEFRNALKQELKRKRRDLGVQS